jgi:hypothetical protein
MLMSVSTQKAENILKCHKKSYIWKNCISKFREKMAPVKQKLG